LIFARSRIDNDVDTLVTHDFSSMILTDALVRGSDVASIN